MANFNIQNHFPSAEHILHNVYIYNWESDIFIQMKSGYHYEIEMKVSKNDFKADFKKVDKHDRLIDAKSETYIQYSVRENKVPNRFFYMAPEELLDVKNIPEYAGLIEYSNLGKLSRCKVAPLLHRRKYNFDSIMLAKYKYRNEHLTLQVNNLKEEVKRLQQTGKFDHMQKF